MPKKLKRIDKPKRTKQWLRRSQAAKKGWETRRARALPKKIRRAKQLLDNSSIARGKKPSPGITTKKRSVKQKQKTLASLEKQLATAQRVIKGLIKKGRKIRKKERLIDKEPRVFTKEDTEEEFFGDWVLVPEPKYLHRDGSIAVRPTMLRHMHNSDKLRDTLTKANALGEHVMYWRAGIIAEYYNVPIQEVYTLFYSP